MTRPGHDGLPPQGPEFAEFLRHDMRSVKNWVQSLDSINADSALGIDVDEARASLAEAIRLNPEQTSISRVAFKPPAQLSKKRFGGTLATFPLV